MSPGRASLMASAIALRRSASIVYFAPVFCRPTTASLMMAQRIFAARIIGGQHHEIAASSRSLAHQRTLGAIAIAAAAENRDHSVLFRLASHKLRANAVKLRKASSVCA